MKNLIGFLRIFHCKQMLVGGHSLFYCYYYHFFLFLLQAVVDYSIDDCGAMIVLVPMNEFTDILLSFTCKVLLHGGHWCCNFIRRTMGNRNMLSFFTYHERDSPTSVNQVSN